MPILVPVLLSFGSINALIPIIIIIILIAAAGGLMRGYDLFALFGLGALVGIGGAAKKGSIASRNPFGFLAGKGTYISKLPKKKPIKSGIKFSISRTPKGEGRLPFKLDIGLNKEGAINAQRVHVTQQFVNNINKYTKNAIDPKSGMLDVSKLTATDLNLMKRDIAKLYSPYYEIKPNNIGVRREGESVVFFDTRTNDVLVRLDKQGAYVETGSGVSKIAFDNMPDKAKRLIWSLNTAHDVRQQGRVNMAVTNKYTTKVKEIENALKAAKSGVSSSDISVLAETLADFDADQEYKSAEDLLEKKQKDLLNGKMDPNQLRQDFEKLKKELEDLEKEKEAYKEDRKRHYEQELKNNEGRLIKVEKYKIRLALEQNRPKALHEDISERKYDIIDERFKEFDKRVQSIVSNPNLSDEEKADMINKERAWLVRALGGMTDMREVVKSIASGNFEEAAREFYNAPRILYPTKQHFSNISQLGNVPKAGGVKAAISTILSTISSVFSMTEEEKRELAKTAMVSLKERKKRVNVATLGKDKVNVATLGEDQDKVKAAILKEKMRNLEQNSA